MIDFCASGHAVLSQNSRQHLPYLLQAYPAALNQAAGHPHMLEHRPIPRSGTNLYVAILFGIRWVPLRRGLRTGWTLGCPAFAILDPFLEPALFASVILDTAPVGALLAVGLPAPKGTTQVFATGIARMSEKENSAMPASAQASSQVSFGSQNRSQHIIVFQHEGSHLAASIPTGSELKMFGDLDCKKPKLSLRVLMTNWISSSYPIRTKVSRRSGGDFLPPRL